MTDYFDSVEMTELFFERFGRDPTGEELADFMADEMAEAGDRAYRAMKDRGIP